MSGAGATRVSVNAMWLYAANAGWRPLILRVGTVVHSTPQPRSSGVVSQRCRKSHLGHQRIGGY